MNLLLHTKQGLQNLYYAKLRSVLALLGVLVGTASVVAMVLGGELATNEALRQFKSLGTDLLAVSINSAADENRATGGRAETLSLPQALALPQADKRIVAVAPYTQLFQPIFYQGIPVNGMILGVTDQFFNITQIQLAAGRHISVLDQYAFYAVIGQDVYAAMKRISYKNPLGQSIQIGKNMFTVVGVAETWPENSFVYANIDNSVLIPIMASLVLSKYTAINNLIVRLGKEAVIPEIEEHISDKVKQAVTGKNVSFRSAKELIARMRKQNDILTIFLGLIGSVSLVVGGIGVMNIMLVSVMERRREIGIRLAVGARRRDIGLLFLIEALILALLGGTLGVIIGITIAYIIAIFSHWQFTLFLWPPLAGFSVSLIVGIFFGFYPALLASRLNPIDALRSD